MQNTVNTSRHITKTPMQLSKHPHITKHTNSHTHTLQNKVKQPQFKIQTKRNSHNNFMCPQYNVHGTFVLKNFTAQHFTSQHLTSKQNHFTRIKLLHLNLKSLHISQISGPKGE
jgi:hypothetical protein